MLCVKKEKKKDIRDCKRKSHIFIGKCQRAQTHHNKVCKVDHRMKFEVNMIHYNEVKSFLLLLQSTNANNLMYQSKITFPPSLNLYVGNKSDVVTAD